jgi:argininosuccinate lyase
MKLWEKGKPFDKMVQDFTTGKDKELDIILARYDIIGSIAHVMMLESVKIISPDESQALKNELSRIYSQILSGEFFISEGVEDVHSEVEKQLTVTLGEAGKKLHTGRSRNDQVLLDIHLFVRDKINEIVLAIETFSGILLTLSEKYSDYFLPGYTHFQAAMPSSFGLWFGSFAETLADDLLVFYAAYRMVDQNPLGSAAGFGTSLPIDRQITTQLLGFENMRFNSVHAMNSRGKSEMISAQAIASLAYTLGKYAGDVCLYMSGNFDFLGMPEKYSTGSSIMPHKHNPDVFEIVRARCSALQALPNQINLLANNLPSGYHRDFQVIKAYFLPAFEDILDCIRIMERIFPELIIKNINRNDEKYKYIFSVENVNRLVAKGKPFREAYREVADAISDGHYKRDKDAVYSHEGSIGKLCNDKIAVKIKDRIRMFEFEKAREAIGGLLNENGIMG